VLALFWGDTPSMTDWVNLLELEALAEQRMPRMLRHELEEAMVLAGRPDIASIDRTLLFLTP
jgi:isopentenyl diphosphate isomerase/L-lactate dehydrogenase-like FMN-dependent dehydrogenase